MTTSSILRHVSGRVASQNIVRSFSATAPAALASAAAPSNGSHAETTIRGAAALMAATAAAGAGLYSWKNEKRADCTAITAVVGKDGLNARYVQELTGPSNLVIYLCILSSSIGTSLDACTSSSSSN